MICYFSLLCTNQSRFRKTLTFYVITLIKSVFDKDKNTRIYSWKNVYISNKNMLYYDRIDILKGIDTNKTSASRV